MIDGEVAEIEERVAHAGVLPVHQPQPGSVVDEVRVQQVVVARAQRRVAPPLLDPVRQLGRVLVAGRAADSTLVGDRPVRLDDAERVEAAGDRPPSVEAAQQRRNLLDPGAPDLALDVARHEVALRLHERDHLRPDPELRGRDGRVALDVAVDSQQLGVLAADAEHERLAAGDDLEVAVRDPAAERLDRFDAAGPDTLGDLPNHARTRAPAGSHRGSAATSPAIQSPKISTSTACPTAARAAGRYA